MTSRAATRKVACTCDQKPCSCPKGDVNYALLHATGKEVGWPEPRSTPRTSVPAKWVTEWGGGGDSENLPGNWKDVGVCVLELFQERGPGLPQPESETTVPCTGAASNRVGGGSGSDVHHSRLLGAAPASG